MPGALRGQKRLLDPLELESPVVVSLQMCVLGTELESSARVANTLSCRTTSPNPYIYIILWFICSLRTKALIQLTWIINLKSFLSIPVESLSRHGRDVLALVVTMLVKSRSRHSVMDQWRA